MRSLQPGVGQRTHATKQHRWRIVCFGLLATGAIFLLVWLTGREGFLRWAYRGHRPNWIARMLNAATAAVASAGIAPSLLVTLEVKGRKSGRIVSLPLVTVTVDGQRFLVSMLGADVQWVRNVRAAAGRAALRSGGCEQIQLEEVPVDQRAPILKAYLQRAPGARPHIRVSKDAPVSEFEKVAADFPVFRLASRHGSTEAQT